MIECQIRRDLMVKKDQSKSNRGKDPKPITKLMLCAKAGGRCQFEGCNKRLFVDGITLKKINNSNIAHIVASAPDGPRGDENSYELSDKLENLMLMCQEHHKLIDDNPEQYTVKLLKKMKEQQEQKIESILDYMNYPQSEIIILESPIKNKNDVKVNYEQTVEAIRSEGNNPASNYPTLVRIQSNENYRNPAYWNAVENELEFQVKYQIEPIYKFEHDVRLAVFPIAPIPLIIKFGNLLGDKRKIDIFQKTRMPDTWIWQSKELTNEFCVEKINSNRGNEVALILSLTADIDISRITNVVKADIIYIISAKRTGVDCIMSLQDLKAFWHQYQNVCDQIKNIDGYSEISLFPAIPVSAAFEIGRRYMQDVFPIIHVFEDSNGFFETITIGGK